jgi:3-hydroxyisobutyrate dehydrogenase-like beta-hydroxyacid dehydrogenase
MEVLVNTPATSTFDDRAVGRMRVGFIGLGRMGSRVVKNVAAGGFQVMLWNRTAETARGLADELSAPVADDPAALAAACDVVMTMVADDAAVDDVYLGERGIVAGVSPGKMAIDLSTVSPVTTRRIAKALRDRGADLVDAPVSGSTAAAESRKLTVMAGGEADAVTRVSPVLEAMSAAHRHVGPTGAGAIMKLAVNSIVLGLNQALSEALVLAERAGIERSTAYEVFANSAVAAPVVHYRRAAFEHPGEGEVSFRLELGAKDLRLIAELAEQVGAPMPQGARNLQTMEEAAAGGFADWDLAGLAEWLRRASSQSRS